MLCQQQRYAKHAKSIEERKQIGVDHVKSSVGLGLFDDTRNVDFAGTCQE